VQPLALCLTSLFGAVAVARIVLTVAAGSAVDALSFLGAATALRTGQNPYGLGVLRTLAPLAHQPASNAVPYLYPPLLAELLIPASLLPYGIAARLWLLVLVGGVAAAIWLLREQAKRLTGAPNGLLAAGLVLTSGPVLAGIGVGNLSVLLLPGFLLLLRWEGQKQRATQAGVLLALLSWLKVYPLVLFGYYAVRGEWRVVRRGALTFLALGLVQLPFANWAGAMLRALLSTSTNAPSLWQDQPLRLVPVRLVATAPTAATAAGDLLVLLVGSMTAYGLWRRRHLRDAWAVALGFGWCLAALVLVLPLAWDHYYLWVLPLGCFGLLLCCQLPRRRTTFFAAVAIIAGLALMAPWYADAQGSFEVVARPLGALLLWSAGRWLYLRVPAPLSALHQRDWITDIALLAVVLATFAL
jgi:alpha-1,2-mannosyltransferase